MEKRPFIIDCDTGTDDAIAILAALGSDAIRVRALTSVNGNVNENFTSRNNRDLVGYLGADVEVARGAKIPFYPRAGYYDATHGSEGLGDVTLPAAENVPFTKETAPELIRRIAEEEEGRLELLERRHNMVGFCAYGDLALQRPPFNQSNVIRKFYLLQLALQMSLIRRVSTVELEFHGRLNVFRSFIQN